jgi:hypothetical protein
MFEPRRRLLSIDLNRAGMGLMEIVSKPDIRYDLRPQLNSEYTWLTVIDLQSRRLNTCERCRLCSDLLELVMETWSKYVNPLMDNQRHNFFNITRDLCVVMLMSLSTVQDNCLVRGAKLRILTASAS